MATCVFHSFSYAGWLPCAKYDRGCGSRKFSTLSRKTRGRRKAKKTKKDAGQSKKQESTRWILPSFCACSAAPTISTFRNNFIIMLFGLSVSQIYFVCQKASLQNRSLVCMHVASYRTIKPRRIFCNTVYKHYILSLFLIIPDFISVVYLFTLTRKS